MITITTSDYDVKQKSFNSLIHCSSSKHAFKTSIRSPYATSNELNPLWKSAQQILGWFRRARTDTR